MQNSYACCWRYQSGRVMSAAIIIGLAAIGIGAAVAAFLRTPTELRFKLPGPRRAAGVEYAEQYTFKERVRLMLMALIFGSPLALLWHFWAKPRWMAFAESSPCYEFWGISGVTVFFYVLYVGLPLLLALLVAIFISRRGAKILRDGQVPYRNEKTLHLTRIRRGRSAVFVGWGHLLAPLLWVALAVWAEQHAEALSSGFTGEGFDYSQCPAGAGATIESWKN